jgi:Bacterial PH domain
MVSTERSRSTLVIIPATEPEARGSCLTKVAFTGVELLILLGVPVALLFVWALLCATRRIWTPSGLLTPRSTALRAWRLFGACNACVIAAIFIFHALWFESDQPFNLLVAAMLVVFSVTGFRDVRSGVVLTKDALQIRGVLRDRTVPWEVIKEVGSEAITNWLVVVLELRTGKRVRVWPIYGQLRRLRRDGPDPKFLEVESAIREAWAGTTGAA